MSFGITKTIPAKAGVEALDSLYDGSRNEYEFHMAGIDSLPGPPIPRRENHASSSSSMRPVSGSQRRSRRKGIVAPATPTAGTGRIDRISSRRPRSF